MASAVPDGASTLASWCASTISATSKKRLRVWESCTSSTAPIAKLGATTTPTPFSSGEGVDGLQFGVRDARCAGNPVNAALDRRSQGGGGHVGNGKVHHHVGSAGLDGRSYVCEEGKVSGKLRGRAYVDSAHSEHVGSGTHCR